MGSGRNGTLYTGMTANLVTRVWKHKTHTFPGFTDDHDCTRLLWFERHAWVTAAIRREKRIKKWLRDWKLALIERLGPARRAGLSSIPAPLHTPPSEPFPPTSIPPG